MELQIITPESSIFSGEATSVSLPGSDGVFQVLNNHTPIISSLKEGAVRFEPVGEIDTKHPAMSKNGSIVEVLIKGGVAELLNNKLIVLAD
ncbi:MAG: F0F1 ATP synthase subunit epsilon [Bacteroidetes bacterium]|nr:F0F1 ATP synthase subunit epsilon [Bacteroidota bacterium]